MYLFDRKAEWATVAYWMVVGGLVGGLAAAVPGWIDWFAIPSGTRAKAVGLYHGVGNVIALGLFGASWWFRLPNYANPDAVGVALLSSTAWLGGELVHRLGVSIDPGANLNAPPSMTGPADAPRTV